MELCALGAFAKGSRKQKCVVMHSRGLGDVLCDILAACLPLEEFLCIVSATWEWLEASEGPHFIVMSSNG